MPENYPVQSAFQFDVEKFVSSVSQMDDALKKEREKCLHLERSFESEKVRYKAALYESHQNIKELYTKFECLVRQTQSKDQDLEKLQGVLKNIQLQLTQEKAEKLKQKNVFEVEIQKLSVKLQEVQTKEKEEAQRFQIDQSIQGSKLKFLTQEINRRTRILKSIHISKVSLKKNFEALKQHWYQERQRHQDTEKRMVLDVERFRLMEQNQKLQLVQLTSERDLEKEKLTATTRILEDTEKDMDALRKELESARTRYEVLENEVSFLREKWAYQAQVIEAPKGVNNVSQMSEFKKKSEQEAVEKIQCLGSLQDLLLVKRSEAERIRKELELIPMTHPRRRSVMGLLEIIEDQRNNLEIALGKFSLAN